MKKLLPITLGLFFSLPAFVMNATASKKHPVRSQTTAIFPVADPSINRSSFVCDTLTNIHATDSIVLYTDDPGYVAGQNSYGDIAKADRFTNLNHVNGNVSAVLLYIGVATAANATDTFSVNIWNETAGTPGPIIGNANYTYQGAVDDVTAQTLSVITFPVPVPITGDFYAGVKFGYTAGDTIGLFSNIDGNTIPNTAWEQWSDNSWYPFDNVDSWGISVSLAILPVVCDGTTGVENVAYDKNVAIYPTVASDLLNIFIGNSTPDASIQITDLSGRVVLSKKLNTMTDHTHQLDIRAVSAGTYMVNIAFGNYSSSKKIIVQK